MNRRILLVDDDPLILLGILTQWKRAGYKIETAASSLQGLELLRCRGPFDVVISDWEMPGMDGLEFLRRCRQQAPKMVRVMFSGAAKSEAIQQAVQESLLFCFISKPCTPRQLAVQLEATLAQPVAALVQ